MIEDVKYSVIGSVSVWFPGRLFFSGDWLFHDEFSIGFLKPILEIKWGNVCIEKF